MTPYERCAAVIEGRRPDCVPAYTPTLACEVASKLLGREVNTGSPSLWYAEAKAWLAGKDAYTEFERKLEEDRLELHQLLGNEIFRYPWRVRVRSTAQIDEHTFLCGDPDGPHQVWRWDRDVMNFIQVANTAPEPQPEDWPALAVERAKGLEDRVVRIREEAGRPEAAIQARLGDRMMVVAGGGGLSLGVHEIPLMAAALEPGAVGDILDIQLEVALAQMEGIAAHGIRVVLGGGDMADKNGPLYSPAMFRALILPRLKKLAARCRELGLHYVWRTDGNIWSVADMIFREAGVPGYGEVDRDAGMELGVVRDRFPQVVIWANVSSALLSRGSRDEVYEHSMKILEESQGLGYFHGCSNAILPGTPAENVWAMMEARDDFSGGTT